MLESNYCRYKYIRREKIPDNTSCWNQTIDHINILGERRFQAIRHAGIKLLPIKIY